MYNPQFNDQRNSYCDIQERLRMEEIDTTAHGLPDDDTNLIQLLRDAQWWIIQAKKEFNIPEDWPVSEPSLITCVDARI
uniref:Uncharacterized protein n=1 Tax=viral metagenome TaxID=1070528 RepID=A0A6H1ZVH6_9ZZZZ